MHIKSAWAINAAVRRHRDLLLLSLIRSRAHWHKITDMTSTLPKLYFLHGNSYPAGTYSAFFAALSAHYDVDAAEMLGHNPAYPVKNGWAALVRESIADLERRYQREPVIVVGHSLGGMLSLMIAKKRPELVRCVVMLDSPVVAGWRAFLWRAVQAAGLGARFSPGRLSRRRRNLWPSAQAAYEHFAAKPMFAAWPPQVLRDYLEYGLEPHEKGVTLRFRREVETAIYNSLPHHMGRLVKARFPVPIGFIKGSDSQECRQAGMAATHTLVGDNFIEIAGTHLYPLESPAVAAAATHTMIVRLLAESGPHG